MSFQCSKCHKIIGDGVIMDIVMECDDCAPKTTKRVLVAYRGIPQSPGWAFGDCLCRAIERAGHVALPFMKFYNSQMWIVHPEWQTADEIIRLEMFDKEDQYDGLAQLRKPTTYWEFDTEIHQEWTRLFLGERKFDRLFMANRKMCTAFGAEYLPIAVDQHLFKPWTGARAGVALVGTPFRERVEFAERTGIKLISGVYREQYVRTIQTLSAAVHYWSSGGEGLNVCRITEALACGTPLISPKCDSMDADFAGCYTDISEWSTEMILAVGSLGCQDWSKECAASHTLNPTRPDGLEEVDGLGEVAYGLERVKLHSYDARVKVLV